MFTSDEERRHTLWPQHVAVTIVEMLEHRARLTDADLEVEKKKHLSLISNEKKFVLKKLQSLSIF
jgi:uncharacterized membrane protein YqjE